MSTGPSPRVVFVPYWGAANPYQDALAEHLSACGVAVEKVRTLKSLFRYGIFLHGAPDIVHLHWLPEFGWRQLRAFRYLVFVLRLLMLRVRGIPLVWTIHNLLPHESRHRKMDWLLTRIVAGLSSGLIVHGESAQRQVVEIWRLRDQSRFAVIPHGNYTSNYPNDVSCTAARKKLGLDDSEMVFLFLGAVRPYKGVLELVDAFRTLAADHVSLVIAGKPLNDNFAREIERAAAGLDRVRFHPVFVQDAEVQVYMNAADVVVLPYRHILSSGAALLAMSFGKPCIAPAIGCLGDVLDASGAFLYDPECETGLVKSMRRAVEAKHTLGRMGAHNHDKVLQWTWEKAAEATKTLYERCLPSVNCACHNIGLVRDEKS
ncbi:MAG: glycosyltransferase [Phycisphaerales bacterium]|nr:MAG: glycosyltransferase [Phycisphaerales bacterium]